MLTTMLVAKQELEKKSALNRIQTHDVNDTLPTKQLHHERGTL